MPSQKPYLIKTPYQEFKKGALLKNLIKNLNKAPYQKPYQESKEGAL